MAGGERVLDKNSSQELMAIFDAAEVELLTSEKINFSEDEELESATTHGTGSSPEWTPEPQADASDEISEDEIREVTGTDSQNHTSEFLNTILRLPRTRKRKQHTQGPGRDPDPARKEFKKDEKIGSTKLICQHCKTPVSNKVERLRAHLKKCSVLKKRPMTSCPQVPAAAETAATSPGVSAKAQKGQLKVTSFVDVIKKSDQGKFNTAIAKYIFSTNLPFAHVETTGFKTFFKILRPGVSLPTRESIAGPLLNQIYAEVIEEQKKSLYEKSVTIMQDGWKSRTKEPVLAHCLTTGERAFFLNAKSAEDNEKTAEFCAELLRDSIEEAKLKFGVTVKAVVTDNCSTMAKMKELIALDFPGIYTYGCHPHLLNLVGKKLTDLALQEKIEKVQKYFRNHDIVSALLKQRNGLRPVLAANTRWNSWIDCFENYLRNQTKYLEVSRMPKAKMQQESTILDIINDRQIYESVASTVKYLKPIKAALNQLQAQTATLADGIKLWLDLKDQLDVRDAELSKYFEKQFGRAVTDVGCAAYLLHPRYRGSGLSTTLAECGNQLLFQKHHMLVILAAQLQEKNPIYFPERMFDPAILDSVSPSVWWTSLKTDAILPNIIKYAVDLLTLPVGSADIERHFATLGNIMSDQRGRLGLEKAEKLCVIYRMFSSSEKEEESECLW